MPGDGLTIVVPHRMPDARVVTKKGGEAVCP
jgi:hypothetical protein